MVSSESDATPTGRSGRSSSRATAVRSRELLIETVGVVVHAANKPLSLADIARHAGLGQATAYRHFSSLEDLLSAYFEGIVSELNEYSQVSQLLGPELFEDVAQHWVELVLINGRAMVQIRSPRGYIERLREGVNYVVQMDEALRRPIEELLKAWGLSAIGDQALQLWNVIFDPREILDAMNTLGFSKPEIVERLGAAFKGALYAVACLQSGRPVSF